MKIAFAALIVRCHKETPAAGREHEIKKSPAPQIASSAVNRWNVGLHIHYVQIFLLVCGICPVT